MEQTDEVTQRLTGVEQRLTGVEQRLTGVEQGLTGVEQRLTVVEHDVAGMQIDVAVIKSNYATKADVLQSKNSTILWIISAFVLTQLLPTLLTRLGI